jgi:4-diphosphocytidyl-2-C-methyl-D-erythritol kinase
LPPLIGKRIPYAELVDVAERLGSDIAFFLHGGTALGLGRGAELYPLPDLPPSPLVIVASGIHVSTAEAYRALNRTLTIDSSSPILREFQTIAWALDGSRLDQLPLTNDFEEAVFGTHPALAGYIRKLRRLGARPALMTGSGSALFGVFASAAKATAAAAAFPDGTAQVARFVSRNRYRTAWMRALGPAGVASHFSAPVTSGSMGLS